MAFPLIRLSLAPLVHTTERQLTWLTLCFGGCQSFSRGVRLLGFKTYLIKDMSNLLAEFQIVRPTQLSAAPSVYSMLYAKYQSLMRITELEEKKSGKISTPEKLEAKVGSSNFTSLKQNTR